MRPKTQKTLTYNKQQSCFTPNNLRKMLGINNRHYFDLSWFWCIFGILVLFLARGKKGPNSKTTSDTRPLPARRRRDWSVAPLSTCNWSRANYLATVTSSPLSLDTNSADSGPLSRFCTVCLFYSAK